MRYVGLIYLILFMFSCATIHHKREEVLQRESYIKVLDTRISEAKSKGVDFLSPYNFEKAQKKLDEAINKAQRSKDTNAGQNEAQEGLKFIEQAFLVESKGNEILGEAFEKRKAARNARAHIYFEKEFNDLDKKLKKAGTTFENGDISSAISQSSNIAKGFNDLEVRSYKIDLSKRAEEAYALALAVKADKLAPITLEQAKKELDIAKKIIEVEKSNYEKAQFHARKAEYLALKAKGLSEIALLFKNKKMSSEQIGLWYQGELEKIHEPYGESLPFDLSNAEVVTSFKDKIRKSLAYISELEGKSHEGEKRLGELKERLSESIDEKEKIRLEKSQREEKFKEVSKLFTKNEAQVLKTDEDILVRLVGFNFKVGSAEVLPSNFTLLNKIVSAILKYPNSNIVVEGHTDSSGSPSKNKLLSEERAKNIAEFLIKVAEIDPARVSSFGYGDEKPIASNNTKEGRAKNRRIEIVIKNAH